MLKEGDEIDVVTGYCLSHRSGLYKNSQSYSKANQNSGWFDINIKFEKKVNHICGAGPCEVVILPVK
jgi:hypothetical protein